MTIYVFKTQVTAYVLKGFFTFMSDVEEILLMEGVTLSCGKFRFFYREI
jgi:hypothetical protein